MSTTRKIIIAALVLLLIGLIIFTVTMCRNNWSVPGVIVKTETVTQTFEISERFDSIALDIETDDVFFAQSYNSRCNVVITNYKNSEYNVGVKNGTLRIEKVKAKGTFLDFGDPSITIYLPATSYNDLSISASTGDIIIPSDFNFRNMDIDMSTGEITCGASVSDKLNLRVSTGEITLYSASAGDVFIKVSTGKAEVKDLRCSSFESDGSTGRISLENTFVTGKIDIERSTGNVSFKNCDANEIEVKTSTGDIKGSLLSDKIFIARSDTGKINVPETLTGGKCKLTSNTGDILITIGR